jgi:glycylpeptide N-tetradecanoyltransferase
MCRALLAPGWTKEWHVGVRATSSRKLVAFISAVPMAIRVRKKVLKASEVNFLCIHKKLRSKRLTPVLIKEITRRCNLLGTWQAIYTAGIVLPKPVSTCRYFHRSLDWQKLNDVGFSPLPAGSKPLYQIVRYKLPDHTAIKGLRVMELKDVDAVLDLLLKYLAKFDMAPVFTREEIVHWMLHKKGSGEQVVWAYVVEVRSPVMSLYKSNFARTQQLKQLLILSPSTTLNQQLSNLTNIPRSVQPTSSTTLRQLHSLHPKACPVPGQSASMLL